LRRFLGSIEGLGDLLEALALLCQRLQLGDFVGTPGLAVFFEAFAHDSVGSFSADAALLTGAFFVTVFFVAAFLAGAFLAAGSFLAAAAFFLAGALRPFLTGGPFAARASIRAIACSAVTSSGFTSRGIVAL